MSLYDYMYHVNHIHLIECSITGVTPNEKTNGLAFENLGNSQSLVAQIVAMGNSIDSDTKQGLYIIGTRKSLQAASERTCAQSVSSNTLGPG